MQSRPFHSKNCALCTARYLFCAEETRLLIEQPVARNYYNLKQLSPIITKHSHFRYSQNFL